MTCLALDGLAPDLGPGVWIAPDAAVIGNVGLGGDVSVWFAAVIRGDGERIAVGPGSNIQDGAVLHTDKGFPVSIGPGVTIGHRAVIHGCTIGENSLIGMGAVLLNGAVIGRDCLIGAGALVTEGRVIPPRSLALGAPARVIRPLTAEEIAANRRSALHYQANARRFAAGLAEVQPGS